MDTTRDHHPATEGPEPPGTVPVPDPDTAQGLPDAVGGGGRRRRRWVFWAAGAGVLVVVAVGGWLVLRAGAEDDNAAAPVAAVKSYVDAIARGDASTANELVDPKRFGRDVDPALLTDEMLGSAEERISVLEVERGAQSGDVVEVTVRFRIMAEKFEEGAEQDMRDLPREAVEDSVTLRVARTGTDLFGYETWEVRDPFLVPMALMVGGATVETGVFGSETVAMNDLRAQEEPERLLVYPALYPLSGPELSRHLEQWPGRQTLTPFEGKRPSAVREPSVAMLMYVPTDEFVDSVAAKVAEHVDTCRTASPFPPACPGPLDGSGGTTVRVVEKPVMNDLLPDPARPYAEGEPLVFPIQAMGKVSLSNSAFPEGLQLPLIILGEATIKPDDSVAVTFTPPGG